APQPATRWATAGVGSTPARSTSAPALVSPATTAASSISPLARGSRPTTASGRRAAASPRTCALATATAEASSGGRSPFARPRTPSVPNSRLILDTLPGDLVALLRIPHIGRVHSTDGQLLLLPAGSGDGLAASRASS